MILAIALCVSALNSQGMTNWDDDELIGLVGQLPWEKSQTKLENALKSAGADAFVGFTMMGVTPFSAPKKDAGRVRRLAVKLAHANHIRFEPLPVEVAAKHEADDRLLAALCGVWRPICYSRRDPWTPSQPVNDAAVLDSAITLAANWKGIYGTKKPFRYDASWDYSDNTITLFFTDSHIWPRWVYRVGHDEHGMYLYGDKLEYEWRKEPRSVDKPTQAEKNWDGLVQMSTVSCF